MTSVNKKLLTIDDLAERWGCDPKTAWSRVRERGVPVVWLGRGSYDATKHGPKLVRFRPESIDRWELSQEHALLIGAAPPAPERPAPPMPIGVAPGGGWDGKFRGPDPSKSKRRRKV